MSRELPDGSEAPESRKETNLRMRFGTDYRYHFEDPEIRKKGGDTGEFEWIEETFEDFIV